MTSTLILDTHRSAGVPAHKKSSHDHDPPPMRFERAFRITGKVALVATVSLAIIGLSFRSLIWASWPPSAGDPYGASDLLEALIFLFMMLCSAICTLAGIGLLFAKPRTLRVLVAGVIVPVAYVLLHPLVPLFELW